MLDEDDLTPVLLTQHGRGAATVREVRRPQRPITGQQLDRDIQEGLAEIGEGRGPRAQEVPIGGSRETSRRTGVSDLAGAAVVAVFRAC